MKYLNLLEHSMVLFDRAYNNYLQFAKFTKFKINFICRLKKNAVYYIKEQTYNKLLNDADCGCSKEEQIAHCLYKVTNNNEK